MDLPKEICLYITHYIDDPSTWSSFMRVCKNAKAICDYRKEQKQYQFKPLTIILQVDDWGIGFTHVCESDEEIQKIFNDHRRMKGLARLAIGGSLWGDGKLIKSKMTRLDYLRKLGSSPL